MATAARVAKGRTSAPQTPRPKRSVPIIDLTNDDDDDDKERQLPSSKKQKTSPKKSPRKRNNSDEESTAEKRLRRWRPRPPVSYVQRLDRALSQRMFVLDRVRAGAPDDPSEELTMAGSTGNLYTVTVGRVPACTCPDFAKGHQCKHIIYALVRVLKVSGELQYQLAFLSSELHEIFARAPLPTEEVTEEDADEEHPNNRKPIEGDCPICFCDMAEDEPGNIVWCRAACGNNVHKACFLQWSKSSREDGGKVRCVYCRTDWEAAAGGGGSSSSWSGDKSDLAALRASATIGEDGYANVADELGIDSVRDSSTYHQPWRWGRRY